VFKSKTLRSTFIDKKKLTSPPVGLYEPKFNKGYENDKVNNIKTPIAEKKDSSPIKDPLSPRMVK
jgi:hypothetical protein